MANILVNFTFKNKKGEEKTVRFYMDKISYETYNHPSISEEYRYELMMQEYQYYCDERNYKKRVVPWPTDENGRDIEFQDNAPSIDEALILEEEKKENQAVIETILGKLTPKQREAYELVHFQEIKPLEACKILGIKKSAFYERLEKAENAVENILNSKKF